MIDNTRLVKTLIQALIVALVCWMQYGWSNSIFVMALAGAGSLAMLDTLFPTMKVQFEN